MANQLAIEFVVLGNDNLMKNLDQVEKKIVDTEKKVKNLGKSGNDAGREIASGLGIPLGPAAAVTAGIGLLTAGLYKSIAAAREASEANMLLSSTAIEAGLSYGDATAKAEAFAAKTGLAGTAAKQTYAALLSVTQISGSVGQVDQFTTALADLAAARGIAPEKLAVLAQQIKSGQDEALNAIGLADPSKLAKTFADRLGRSVESLSQAEQVMSRQVAVVEKGVLFVGAADQRLASVAGQINQAEQATSNFSTAIGVSILANREFRDVLSTVNVMLKSVSISADEVAASLAKGNAPEKIAAEMVAQGTKVRIALGIATAGASDLLLRINSLIKNGLEAEEDGANKIGQAATAALTLLSGGVAGQFLGKDVKAIDLRTQAYNESLKEVRKTKDLLAIQDKEAEKQRGEPARKAAADAAAASEKERVAAVEKQIKVEEDRQKQIQTTFADTQTFLNDMLERVNKDNPYVKLFSEADTVMERMQKRFGTFGNEFVGQMALIERKALDMELLAARIQSAQKVLDIEAEIRKLQFGQVGTSAEDQRQLGVYGKQVDAARDIPGLEAKAIAAASGRDPNALSATEQRRILEQQVTSILNLKNQIPGLSEAGSREAQTKINQELIGLYESASPEMKKLFMNNYRGQLSGAFQGQADDKRQAIEDEMRRAEAGRMDVELAQKKLADLNRRGGLGNDEVRKQYLAVTGGLSPSELTGEMRTGRTAALQIEAKKEAEKEKKAEEDRKLLNEALKLITKQITGKGFKTDTAGAAALIEIKNGSDKASVTGPGFGADEEGRAYSEVHQMNAAAQMGMR